MRKCPLNDTLKDVDCINCIYEKNSDCNYTLPEFREFKKIPRLSRDMIISEKIDGTNGLIYINEENNIFAGSKNKWLNDHNDNHGFWHWVMENKEELLKLGNGYHYGEWWGRGIQRGYGLEEKRFSLFNTNRWCMWDRIPQLISIDPKTKIEKYQIKAPRCCYIVPILYEGMFDTAFINGQLTLLKATGSEASPGFMNPEGIIIYHIAGGYYFKKTFDGDLAKNE